MRRKSHRGKVIHNSRRRLQFFDDHDDATPLQPRCAEHERPLESLPLGHPHHDVTGQREAVGSRTDEDIGVHMVPEQLVTELDHRAPVAEHFVVRIVGGIVVGRYAVIAPFDSPGKCVQDSTGVKGIGLIGDVIPQCA